MERRDLFNLAFSGLAAFAAACNPASDGEVRVLQSAEGQVLQWEKEELIVLVSGQEAHYRPGQSVKLHIVLNNQSAQPVQARVRTKLVGRGMQAVAEAPAQSVTVGSQDAATLEPELPLPESLRPGEYDLLIELPPWTLERSGQTSGGGRISHPISIQG